MGEHGDSGTRLRVTLLGAFEVRVGDTVVPVPGARLRGLLVRLALAGGRSVEPAVLVGALWPGAGPSDPANSLQSLVSRLRRVLGAASLVVQNEAGYRLDVIPDDVDALRFERLAADGRVCLRAGDVHQAVRVLGQAVELWAGPPVLPGKAWLETIRAEATADLAEAELALGQPAAAAARLTALLAADPVHERAAALLMDALAAQGRQAEALVLYESVRAALADRLGADPGAALRERHTRLLRAEPAVGAREPVREKRSNLPEPLTSFVGRDDDLARIDGLLAVGRLVTVLGPGGAGKTRLAVEAARRRRHEFRDGVWLVDLAAVTEPAKVGAALLTSAGLRGSAMFEPAARLRVEAGDVDLLVEQLDGRETLLVVDNCEHLVDAVAHLIASLLPRCAGMRVLATSREPLAVDGEALVPLGPLALPGPDDTVEQARRTASVRLFTERAAAVRPGFDVDATTLDDVRRITVALDGMPLALELAAARLRTMSLPELTAGLSDRFRLLTTGNRTAAPRHRTLRGVIAWSWDLLGDHERTVAERVSVLPGGVTPATAVAVCEGTDVPAGDVPDLLAALVDRSLLQLAPDAGRYRMLETLREYGTERLSEQGVLGEVRGLAARHLAALTARLDPELRGPGQVGALRVLGPEYDNVLAALRHLCDVGDTGAALTLALDLTWYWQMFGRHNEAAYWIGEALAQAPAQPSPQRDCAEALLLLNRISTRSLMTADEIQQREAEMRALAGRLLSYTELPGLMGAMTGMTLFFVRENDAALTVLNRLAEGSDAWESALAHLIRAQFAENEGNLEQVRVDLAAAIDRFGRVGDRWGVATALPMRALLRQYDGDLDGALDDLSQARALAREFGSLSLTDEVFIDLRWIDLHMRRGDDDLAVAMLDATRERMARSASPELTVLLNALESGLWIRFGQLDRADRLLDRAEAEMAAQPDLGGDHGRAIAGAMRAALFVERGDAEGAEKALAAAYAAGLETRDMPILSLVAVTAAGLAEIRHRPAETARLLGAAARLRGAHDRTDPRIREMSARAREVLGADGFDKAYGQGWSLDGKTASIEVGRFGPRIGQ
ncbi:SARP family transcriptional regulator [Paractinoplanes abujensis]|uniref:Putative ATPase n=1 Tax=Paractinoplanes abujensis TaxID=882441 RepID=A0A7W7FZT5_9ACTN|nr:AfsR/SARP family transcriptional regulator [Actinoplanes abujensis]MBB4692423.1 putative ATPase [Actinoplanes abujensis]GID24100.1 SARP family transcriptional regulator [Actinoplanes abujensis]